MKRIMSNDQLKDKLDKIISEEKGYKQYIKIEVGIFTTAEIDEYLSEKLKGKQVQYIKVRVVTFDDDYLYEVTDYEERKEKDQLNEGLKDEAINLVKFLKSQYKRKVKSTIYYNVDGYNGKLFKIIA